MEKENARLRSAVSDLTVDEFLSPAHKRVAVDHMLDELSVSQH